MWVKDESYGVKREKGQPKSNNNISLKKNYVECLVKGDAKCKKLIQPPCESIRNSNKHNTKSMKILVRMWASLLVLSKFDLVILAKAFELSRETA